MTLKPEAAIKEAEAALIPFKENYATRLKSHLAQMQEALETEDFATLAILANNLKGEAGTMGWPLVSQAAGWMRQLLEAEKDEPDLPAITLFVQALAHMFAEKMVGEAEQGVVLIKQLYALAASRGVTPV